MASITSVRPLRLAFIHPDLGIGGAERLIVDAATGLQDLGHSVEIYTSHWDKQRCFQETRDGTLKVTVLGNILPIHISHKFHIVLAILRQFHLALSLIYKTYFDSSFVPPDLYFVDQLSACVPLIRWFTRTRVVFYCHFPDLLLSPGRGGFASGVGGAERKSVLRWLYRMPIDKLEEVSTGMADRILVNSNYTATMFRSVFPDVRRQLQIVYPGIKTDDYINKEAKADQLVGSRPTLLSLNRFEPKKNVVLAIEAFSITLKSAKVPSDLRLVIAGGYDERVDSCMHTLRHLQRTAEDLKLSHSTTDMSAQIIFLTNLSQDQKLALLQSKNTKALLYTPSFEHLGIVPLEAMACGLPVIAVKNGGPMETVQDDVTGLLRASNKQEWSEAIITLVNQSAEERQEMGEAGQKRVHDYFDVGGLARGFEKAARDVLQEVEEGKLADIWMETATLQIVFALVMVFLCALSIGAMLKYGRGADEPKMKIGNIARPARSKRRVA